MRGNKFRRSILVSLCMISMITSTIMPVAAVELALCAGCSQSLILGSEQDSSTSCSVTPHSSSSCCQTKPAAEEILVARSCCQQLPKTPATKPPVSQSPCCQPIIPPVVPPTTTPTTNFILDGIAWSVHQLCIDQIVELSTFDQQDNQWEPIDTSRPNLSQHVHIMDCLWLI